MMSGLVSSRLLIFCCVGILNTAVHTGVVIGLVELAGWRSTSANIAAFFAANLMSYFLNSRITFKAALSHHRYIKFLGSSLVVLFFTVSIAALCESAGVHYLIATLSLMIMSPILSFIMVKRFAFRN